MPNKFYLKFFLFFLGIEILIVGIGFKQPSLIIIGLLNIIVILAMFFDISFAIFQKYGNYLKDVLMKLSDKLFFKEKNHIENRNKFDGSLILDPLKLFYLKGGFVLSVIVLVLALFDKILFHKFGLNLLWSGLFFLIGLIVSYQNILKGELYIGNRLLTPKDVVFLLSLLLIIVLFVLLDKFPFYEKSFYSLLVGFVFYLVIIYGLDYVKLNLKFFKSAVVIFYLILLGISSVVFIFRKIPEVKDYFTIKQVVYKEKPVVKEKIVYKKVQPKITSKIHIAPNGKIYEVFIGSGYVYFTGYNGKRKYFDSYEQAVALIDKFNQKKEIITSNSLEKSNLKENTKPLLNQNQDVESNDIVSIMSALLNDEPVKFIEKTNSNKKLTYYDIIPYLIKRYNLSTNGPDIYFKYISKTDPNYQYFKIAYYYKMFGKYSNPNSYIKCRNFAVLLGLAQGWKLQYNRANVFDVFYKEAIKRGYKFNTCCKSQYDYLTEEKKICILK